MKLIKCDKCGKVIKENVITAWFQHEQYDDDCEYDLCEDCYNEIINMLSAKDGCLDETD